MVKRITRPPDIPYEAEIVAGPCSRNRALKVAYQWVEKPHRGTDEHRERSCVATLVPKHRPNHLRSWVVMRWETNSRATAACAHASHAHAAVVRTIDRQ